MTVEEYGRARLYTIARASHEHAKDSAGEWIDIVQNEPYENEHGKGQYTYKIIHLDDRVPSWLRYLAPANAFEVHEKAWNAYPYSKTEYTAPLAGDRFKMTIETTYEADNGSNENALKLSDEILAQRQVELIDILTGYVDPAKYKPEEDPATYVSQKTGRGPLKEGWINTTQPIMCSYKLCAVEFRYWGLQTRVENYIHDRGLRDIMVLGHRQSFCWMDEWFDLTIEDLRRYEDETKERLAEIRKQKEAAAAENQ